MKKIMLFVLAVVVSVWSLGAPISITSNPPTVSSYYWLRDSTSTGVHYSHVDSVKICFVENGVTTVFSDTVIMGTVYKHIMYSSNLVVIDTSYQAVCYDDGKSFGKTVKRGDTVVVKLFKNGYVFYPESLVFKNVIKDTNNLQGFYAKDTTHKDTTHVDTIPVIKDTTHIVKDTAHVFVKVSFSENSIQKKTEIYYDVLGRKINGRESGHVYVLMSGVLRKIVVTK
jgi:hypothetical protein